ncbi:MAG: hypothetical protein IPM29_14140 [Planctomycetes bacterium]|nr:hypothetical protein [Planctomycetota bacterium]
MVAFAVAPVASWALWTIARAPDLRAALLVDQHLGRVVDPHSHPGSPLKPTLELLALWLPWTPFVLVGLLTAVRNRASAAAAHRAWLWLAGPLLFFSAIAEKRAVYLLPIYPAAALLAAHGLCTWSGARGWRSAALRAAVLLATAPLAAVGVAGLAAPLWLPTLTGAFESPAGLAGRAVAFGPPVLAVALLAMRAARRRDWLAWARAVARAWLVTIALGAVLLVPVVDREKSPRHLAARLAGRPEQPTEIPCIGVRPEGYAFYAGRPAVADPRAARIAGALARDDADFLALVAARELLRLPTDVLRRVQVVDAQGVGSRRVLVLGRRQQP